MAEESVGGRSVRKSDCKSLMCDNCLCRLAHLHKLERTHVSDFLIEKENSGKKIDMNSHPMNNDEPVACVEARLKNHQKLLICLTIFTSLLVRERIEKKVCKVRTFFSPNATIFRIFFSYSDFLSLGIFRLSHNSAQHWKYPNNPTCFLSPFQLFGVLATTFYPFFSMFEFSSSSESVRVGSKTENFSGKLKWK